MDAARHIALGLAMAAASLHVQWHHSTALGTYSSGALAGGVRLPPAGRAFLTWDPVLRRSPNRAWRRFGTDRLVRTVLTVARDFHAAHPRAPRLLVGDLSRPHGGDFGPRFGYIGHASHQNGLDVDVYYPRADRRELAPRDARDIDRGALTGARGPLPRRGSGGDLRGPEHRRCTVRPGGSSRWCSTTTTCTCGCPLGERRR